MFHSLGASDNLPLISTSEDHGGARDPAVLIGESSEAWLSTVLVQRYQVADNRPSRCTTYLDPRLLVRLLYRSGRECKERLVLVFTIQRLGLAFPSRVLGSKVKERIITTSTIPMVVLISLDNIFGEIVKVTFLR